MHFVLDPPAVHVEEEEIVDARDFLPPSFFSTSAPNSNFHFPFEEPPSRYPSHSPALHSPPLPPPRANSLPPCIPDTRNSPCDPLPATSVVSSPEISHSVSSDTSSTQDGSATTADDPITSPVPFKTRLDRAPCHHNSTTTTSAVSIGKPLSKRIRIPGAVPPEPEDPSLATPNPMMVCSPGTLRRINAISSDQFRIATRGFGARRASSAKGDLKYMRNRHPDLLCSGEQRRPETNSQHK